MSTVMESTHYMLDNADSFFQKVADYFSGSLDHDMAGFLRSTDGLVQAHGDKVEQYRDYWEKNGLDFNKAQLIYLLTYTQLFPADIPKSRSKEWTWEMYSFYSRFLP